MGRILAMWIWAFFLRRPLLAVCYKAFLFANHDAQSFARPLGSKVRTELSMDLYMFPLTSADLRGPIANYVQAFDDSSRGAGVVYRTVSDARSHLVQVRSFRVFRGWISREVPYDRSSLDEKYELREPDATESAPLSPFTDYVASLFAEADFKTAISVGWTLRHCHISELELHAVLPAARHMAHSNDTRGTRVPILIYSVSDLGAVTKGRSTSEKLNEVCHRLTAVLREDNLVFLPHWVPSEANHVDGTSRHTSIHSNAASRARGIID